MQKKKCEIFLNCLSMEQVFEASKSGTKQEWLESKLVE
jgi:hypothetical protein